MSAEVDITIIGAGVVGCAMAKTLAMEGRTVYLLEKNEIFGNESTARSGASTHVAWLPPVNGDPLKYKLCVPGRRKLWELVDKYNLPHYQHHKLFPIAEEADFGLLQEYFDRGIKQGCENLQILTRQELKKVVPEVDFPAAIYIPKVYKLDAHSLLQCYVSVAIENGAEVVYNSKVVGIDRNSDGYKITVDNPRDPMTFTSRLVINCAGLGSEKIARLAGIDTEKAGYQLYINGNAGRIGYNITHGKSKILTTTSEPCPIWKGPSLACDIEGLMRLSTGGFAATRLRLKDEDADNFKGFIKQYTEDYDPRAADPEGKRQVYESIKSFLPFLELDDLESAEFNACPDPAFEGYMGTTDWSINEESDKGLPGFVNMTSITSPAFTSSLAIAEYVADMIKDQL